MRWCLLLWGASSSHLGVVSLRHCSGAIPKAKVVIATTGLVWEQKAHVHSVLRVHVEQVDILVGEEAQQDMDLKSAFVPAIPRQPFLRLLFGDPKQSPGGVADNLREHRTLLLKAPIGLLAAHRWCMPHDLPAVLCNLPHSSSTLRASGQGFPLCTSHRSSVPDKRRHGRVETSASRHETW